MLEAVKSNTLKLDGLPNVKILPALSQIDVSRNWALRTAKDLVEQDARAPGKSVEVRKAKNWGVYVDGEAAFTQEHRYDPRGGFQSSFADLKLP